MMSNMYCYVSACVFVSQHDNLKISNVLTKGEASHG